MELPPEVVDAILAHWPIADLGTIGEDGRPHLVPIVFVRLGDALWSPIDGKPKSGRELARLRNLHRDARVTLLLQHYDPDWTRLWWLRVEGKAEVCVLPGEGEAGSGDADAAVSAPAPVPASASAPVPASAPASADSDAAASAAVAALRAKYPEYARVPVLGPGRTLIRIGVDSTRGWAASEVTVRGLGRISVPEKPGR